MPVPSGKYGRFEYGGLPVCVVVSLDAGDGAEAYEDGAHGRWICPIQNIVIVGRSADLLTLNKFWTRASATVQKDLRVSEKIQENMRGAGRR
jgi:hypothetical protein